MRISILQATLAVAAFCPLVLGQGATYSMVKVTNLVNQLNTEGLEQMQTIALFDESTREEYLRDKQGPLMTYYRLLNKMYNSLSGIRRRTQDGTPGSETEQKALTSSYHDMTDTHIEMLEAFVDKLTTLWPEEGVPARVGIRLLNYGSALKGLGNGLPNYAPNNATELQDLTAALQKEFKIAEEAFALD